VRSEFEDVLRLPGDEAMVDQAVRDALDAGVTEQEIAVVFASKPRDEFWVPLVAGRLGVLARHQRGPRLRAPLLPVNLDRF
jgi:hypothetical protein